MKGETKLMICLPVAKYSFTSKESVLAICCSTAY